MKRQPQMRTHRAQRTDHQGQWLFGARSISGARGSARPCHLHGRPGAPGSSPGNGLSSLPLWRRSFNQIMLNSRLITGWDPFLERHDATIPNPEQVFRAPGGRVRVRGFVLPHRDRFQTTKSSRKRRAGGMDRAARLLCYRQKRLLSAGGWLGLGGSRAWTREEPSRLARLRIDIPNTADHEWRIDIRKAIARAPDTLRKPLQSLCRGHPAEGARGIRSSRSVRASRQSS